MDSLDRSIALWRGMRVLALVRVLLVTAIAGSAWLATPDFFVTWQARGVAGSYWLCALIALALNLRRATTYRGLLTASLAVDVLHITALLFWGDFSRSIFASLFFLPVVGAALLAAQLAALGTAAAATISLLCISFLRYPVVRDDGLLLQTALLGTGFFAVALVLNRIARRVIEQETVVREQQRRLESQRQLNRTVVRELDRGLLAVAADGEVQLLNAQAVRLLGVSVELGLPARQTLQWAHPGLWEKLWAWRQSPRLEVGQIYEDLTIQVSTPGERSWTPRRLRVRPLAAPQAQAGLNDLLVALEDLRELEGRATQLKLASMGRLTASIAHEIRNPLAAISHAAALMAEESPEPPRLLRIVQENVRRIDRIVQDVLSVSRGGRASLAPVVLLEVVMQAVAELQRDPRMSPDRVSIRMTREALGMFDRAHLLQILGNLLQNASRYASVQKGAIRLTAQPSGPEAEGRLDLVIEDDGPGLSAEVRAHLFEPFFTTHAQGTGLGLYLARELAVANEANLFVREDNAQPIDRLPGAAFVLRMKSVDNAIETTDRKETA